MNTLHKYVAWEGLHRNYILKKALAIQSSAVIFTEHSLDESNQNACCPARQTNSSRLCRYWRWTIGELRCAGVKHEEVMHRWLAISMAVQNRKCVANCNVGVDAGLQCVWSEKVGKRNTGQSSVCTVTAQPVERARVDDRSVEPSICVTAYVWVQTTGTNRNTALCTVKL